MNYGTTAFGASAIGGSPASLWFTFFPFLLRAPDILFEAQLEFGGGGEFFTLSVNQNTESGDGVLYKAYTSNGPGQTPQLQSTFAGIGETLIGAAAIIIVTGQIDSAVWAGGIQFSIRGRAGA